MDTKYKNFSFYFCRDITGAFTLLKSHQQVEYYHENIKKVQRLQIFGSEHSTSALLNTMNFMRFLDLIIADDVPDSRLVLNFREQLPDSGLTEELFVRFLRELKKLNLAVNEEKYRRCKFYGSYLWTQQL